jgi:hypothetical protein
LRFIQPWFFALVAPFYFLIFWGIKRIGTQFKYSDVSLVRVFRTDNILRLFRAFLFVISVLFISAMSRPVINGLVPVVSNSRDTIILIDKSGSMGGPYLEDANLKDVKNNKKSSYKPSKYDLAREMAARFIESRPEDRITACVFYAEITQCVLPLVKDMEDHKVIISWLRLPDSSEGGTPLAEALVAVLKHLEEMGKSAEKTLILLSDGEGNTWPSSLELQILELLQKTNTKLYWVYIEERIIIESILKKERYWMDSQLGLFRLIEKSGGKFFLAGNSQMLEGAVSEIKKLSSFPTIGLEKKEIDIYHTFLSLAVLIFVMVFVALRRFIL